ncbi:F-box protein At2g02240-like [Bidens hawaiensis]|uniref:F-box protein At2g02240-like n=1 Tax=Bidens hawaiensis TaxID=980011 RepID=UPI0040496E81
MIRSMLKALSFNPSTMQVSLNSHSSLYFVEHEDTENSREIQQVLESNSNLDQALQIPTKREMILKGSINYDYGEELFSLNEVNGKKHLMLSAKAALYNTSNLDLFVPKQTPKSRFEEVLELLPQQIFRISCTIKGQMLSRDANYVCYLVFKLSENCNEMHGPVEVRDLLQKNKVPEFVYFRTPSPWNMHNITQIPKQRRDRWMEVKVGKFKTNRELENDCVSVNLKFVSYEGTLSGLIVCGLEFRPMQQY